GYWRDVGTVASYYDTSMELLDKEPEFNLYEAPIMSNADFRPPHFVGENGKLEQCLVGNGSVILGEVTHSILSVDSFVGEGAVVKDSILLPGAKVEAGAKIYRTVMSENACVKAGVVLGSKDDDKSIILLGDNEIVERG
ncbi:MAG: glucose-1-phosphate adenylyltransferase, partial [Oscillospiraceae bacterium]|nr:glucose-1-phosphate adenylyltransferase [Oscillospiraceae bacterium]